MLPDLTLSQWAVSAILVLVGQVNFVPLGAVTSSRALANAYGIAEPGGDLEVLLRHRAVLFGITGGFVIIAAFVPALQVAAVIMAYLSMTSYVALEMSISRTGPRLRKIRNVDIVALILLTIIPVIWSFTGPPRQG